MEVTPACYAHLLNSLLCLAGGKVAVILEVSVAGKRGPDGKGQTCSVILRQEPKSLNMCKHLGFELKKK
jgi:hypothetical protein